MAETSSVASHVLKPSDSVEPAPSNGIDLKSKIAAFSNQPLADKLGKCLADVGTLNNDLGVQLTRLLGELIGSQGKRSSNSQAAQPALDEDSILTTAPKISCANPKGKFDVVFTRTTLALRNAKNVVLQIAYTDIKAVYILDSLPAERSGKVYLVLQFKSSGSVTHGKRELDNFTFELNDKQELDVPSPQAVLQRKQIANVQGAAAVVLCGLLGQMQVTTFMAPDKAVFSGRGGSVCIGALLKFNQGYLFPLKDALLFVGSQCFVLPHEVVLGVDMPGADSERRSFDIVFHGHSGENLYELAQVDMRDLPAWGDYMQRTGMKQVAHADPAVAGAAGAGTSAAGTADEGEADAPDLADLHAALHRGEGDDDDEEEDDEDFDANAEEEDSDADEGSQDHYEGGAGLPPPDQTSSKKRRAPDGDAGPSSGRGGAAGSAALAVATGPPQRKRLRSAGPTNVFELPDDVIAAELGALEEVEDDMDSEGGDSDADE